MRRAAVDVLYVAAATTAGLRRADDELVGALRGLGVDVAMVTPSYPTPGRFASRSLLSIDALECLCLRRATVRGLRSFAPRAIVYSTTHAAMLQPRRAARHRVAIRFDTPAQLSRRGARYGAEFLLERLRFKRARLLVPSATTVGPDTARLLPAGTPVVPIPIPIDLGDEPPAAAREPLAVCYAASPDKKGLDTAIRAWDRVSAPGWRLIVTGLDRERGLRYLFERGIEEPSGVRWMGLLSPEDHRSLTRRADIYLAAARYENYGIAPLEALADGSALVTTPSPGPFAALPIARELDARLVADGDSPDDLAAALAVAVSREEPERASYRARAREHLHAYSRPQTTERLRRDLLPVLLG
jgi:glycosyltransferase involved in cell wall biosynthesis